MAAGIFEDMVHDLRVLLRLAKGKAEQPSAAIFDGRTLQFTTESGQRAGYDGHKRKKGSKIHIAVDTLRLLLAAHVTPANEQPQAVAKASGLELLVVKLPEAKTLGGGAQFCLDRTLSSFGSGL